TLARKQRSAQNDINIPNFLYNGLKEAFDAVRNGGESQLLTDMLTGMNIAGSNFGLIGSDPGSTAGIELRASTLTATGVTGTLQSNLANGNYVAVARILNLANYQSQFNTGLPPIPAGTNGAILRFNKTLPENFIVTNPQFAAINWISNNASNN